METTFSQGGVGFDRSHRLLREERLATVLLLLDHLLLDQRLGVNRSHELLGHNGLSHNRLGVDRLHWLNQLLHNQGLSDNLLANHLLTDHLTLNEGLTGANHLALHDGTTGCERHVSHTEQHETKREDAENDTFHDPPSFRCNLSSSSINGPLDSSGSLWSLGMLPSRTDLRASTIWSPVRFVTPSYTMPALGVAPL